MIIISGGSRGRSKGAKEPPLLLRMLELIFSNLQWFTVMFHLFYLCSNLNTCCSPLQKLAKSSGSFFTSFSTDRVEKLHSKQYYTIGQGTHLAGKGGRLDRKWA